MQFALGLMIYYSLLYIYILCILFYIYLKIDFFGQIKRKSISRWLKHNYNRFEILRLIRVK